MGMFLTRFDRIYFLLRYLNAFVNRFIIISVAMDILCIFCFR
jgi:hypothetical protein